MRDWRKGRGMNKLKAFEEIIGYKFSDKELLRTAITHSSMQTKTEESISFLMNA